MTPDDRPIADQLAEIRSMILDIRDHLASPRETRESYSVEEAAANLGKRPYTVREWCRGGRINAAKRIEKRGGAELWVISAAELIRYQNEGLLPTNPGRNVA